jgi:hypothetical protein
MVVGTRDQISNNWEDGIDFVDEEYACRKRALQIEGRVGEGGNICGSVYTMEGND